MKCNSYKKNKLSQKQLEIINGIKYNGIKKWMIKNNISLASFSENCGYKKSVISCVGNFLNGITDGNILLIIKILNYTGLTFEEAFCK